MPRCVRIWMNIKKKHSLREINHKFSQIDSIHLTNREEVSLSCKRRLAVAYKGREKWKEMKSNC